MAERDGDCTTVIGPDAKLKGELSFDKSVRIEGAFEGQIKSKGNLMIAEGAKVVADIEAANVKLEGECRGNLHVTEKLQLMATARMEGDLRTTRLEIADGAIFVGNVSVGQAAADAFSPRSGSAGAETAPPGSSTREGGRAAPPSGHPPHLIRPRPQEAPAPAPANS